MVARIAVIAVVVGLTACASMGGEPIRPVTDPEAAVQGPGFSVLPPTGSGWHVLRDSGSATVVFAKKDPEHIRQRGSVFVAVALVKARTDIATPDALRAELEREIRASSPRYRLTRLDLDPYTDAPQGTVCVRIGTTSEERDNPNRPGETLLMTITGKACRHPLSPRHYVLATLSERRPIEAQPLVDDRLRAETGRTFERISYGPLP